MMNREETWLLHEKYKGIVTEDFRIDCKRLSMGEPLAYIIGYIPFLGAHIHLLSHPLIPRPETEYWTEFAIQDMQKRDVKHLKVLDLCAGSGCIGIATLIHVPHAYVDFVECEERHHETIRMNLWENHIDEHRTQILGGDLFERTSLTYDLILSNPPYIDRSLQRTARNVIEHEPHEALFADENGLALIKKIIKEAPQHLEYGGALYLEHEPEQCEFIQAIAAEAGLQPMTYRDQYNVERFTRMTRTEHLKM